MGKCAIQIEPGDRMLKQGPTRQAQGKRRQLVWDRDGRRSLAEGELQREETELAAEENCAFFPGQPRRVTKDFKHAKTGQNLNPCSV